MRHAFPDEYGIRPNAAVMLFVNGIPDPNSVGVVGVIPAKITELALPPNEVDIRDD
ncbi:MAG TPA: hypothetical protein GX527_06740 [Clostridiaceae bacterium]|nr:hypothetical protein [Clostridiaceae bacterium]